MQGFQPIYSGNTLTQAAGRAGQFIVAAGEARGRMYESIGKTVGGLAQMAGTAYAQYSAENAAVPESQVQAAQAQGVDFGPRERIDTGGGDSGIIQFKPVTQSQYSAAMGRTRDLQGLSLSNLNGLSQLLEAGRRAYDLRTSYSTNIGAQNTLNSGSVSVSEPVPMWQQYKGL